MKRYCYGKTMGWGLQSGDGGDEVDATSLSSETSCIPESGTGHTELGFTLN